MTGEPVRVGFLIDTLAPGAGTENQLLLLLGALDRSRVAPFLFCLREDPAFPLAAAPCPAKALGVVKLASPRGARALLGFRGTLRRERIALLVTFFRDANAFGTLAAVGGGRRVVSSRRNLGRGYWHTPGELRLLRLLNRFTHRWAANSEAVRRYTAEAEGIASERIAVLPNAVDLDRFRPGGAGGRVAARARLGLDPARRLVGCVANLRRVKGVDVLVEAFAALSERHRDVDLVLVGEGEERETLARRTAALGLPERIRFLGARADVPEILHALDVAVLPSRGEGSSNALLEYAAAGLPSVATRVGGNPELLEGARCGLLVPAEDPGDLARALGVLLDDPAEAAAMGARGRARVEALHGLDAVARTWEAFLVETAGAAVPEP